MFAGLKFVQLQKNQSLHAGTKLNPFKSVYGSESKIKLETNIVPEILRQLILVASSTTRNSPNAAIEENQHLEDEDEDCQSMDDDFEDRQPIDDEFEDRQSIDDKIRESQELDFESAESVSFCGSHTGRDELENDAIQKISSPKSSNRLRPKISSKQPRKRLRRKLTIVETSSDEDEIVSKVYLTRKRRKVEVEAKQNEVYDSEDKEDDACSNFGSEQNDEDGMEYDRVLEREDMYADLEKDSVYGGLGLEEDANIQENEPVKEIFCCVCNLECSGFHKCIICNQFAHTTCGKTQGEEGCGSSVICHRCEIRNEIRKNTSQQAQKMLKRSNEKLAKVSVDDNVLVPIPAVERAKCEFSNLICIVLAKEDDFYVVGCRAGWLKEKFVRNAFQKCSSNFLTPNDVPKKWVALRSAATLASVDGKAQGMIKCNCKKSCSVGRCKCKRMNLFCNSKCHKSDSCDNK